MARHGAPHCEEQPLESGLGAPRGTGVVGHSDARTRAMLEEIDEGFFALDWEYRYLHANQVALRIAQKPLEELLGHTPWELYPQLQGSPLAEHYRAAMELGVPSVLEHRSVITGDWLEVRIYPTPAGVSAYYRLVNEQKRREVERESLLADQRRQAQLSEALNAINSAVGALLESSDALRDVLRLAGEALGCRAGNVAVRDAGRWTTTQVWNMSRDDVDRLGDGEPPCADLALAEQRPIAVEDYANDPLGNAETAERFDVGAMLAIPLTVGGEGFGCLLFTCGGAARTSSARSRPTSPARREPSSRTPSKTRGTTMPRSRLRGRPDGSSRRPASCWRRAAPSPSRWPWPRFSTGLPGSCWR